MPNSFFVGVSMTLFVILLLGVIHSKKAELQGSLGILSVKLLPSEDPADDPASPCNLATRLGFLVSDAARADPYRNRSRGTWMTFPTKPSFDVKATRASSIFDHHSREHLLYQLMEAAIRKTQRAGNRAAVVDAGANHGTYAMFAATLGADVSAIEPQTTLVGNVIESIEKNGLQAKIRLYHNAVLDRHIGVHIGEGDIGPDGGVAKIFAGGDLCSVTLDDIIGDRDISFLKIDVEGNDIKVLRSAPRAYHQHLVHNVLVEFGPPQRWLEVANQTASDGVLLMEEMDKLGFTTWLAPSLCSDAAAHRLKLMPLMINKVPLSRIQPSQFRPLVDIMERTNNECYMYWTLERFVRPT